MNTVLVVLLGLLVSSITGLAALVTGLWGLFASERKRGVVLSGVACGLSLLTALCSAPVWAVTLSGHDTRGETISWRDDSAFYLIVAGELALLLLAVMGLVRQSRALRAGRSAIVPT